MKTMQLLSKEAEASIFVANIGLTRAHRVLDAVFRRFDRRVKRACEGSLIPISRKSVYQTDLEIDLIHKLKLGIMLNDNSNTPYAAHQRILARIAERNARRANRSEKCGGALRGH